MNFTVTLQPLIDFLQLHPDCTNIITFFVVFFEALAVVGVIIPGSITMTALGVLIGAGIIPAGSTFVWGIFGAILGDLLSYWIGVHYQKRLHRIWPFTKWPELLDKSEIFVKKHGGKSILIGRFIGPLRAMVPLVAGMFKMRVDKFALVAIPSIALWAIAYMLPGIIVGALAQELPPGIALQFIVAILITIILVWAIMWLIRHFAKKIYSTFDHCIKCSWLLMQRHQTLQRIAAVIVDPRAPENHQQLSLMFLAVLTLLAFLVVLVNVAINGVLVVLNDPIYNILLNLRVIFIDRIMIAITLLGTSQVLITSGLIFLIWLIYQRYWYVALHWAAAVFLSAGAILGIKTFFFFPRPDETLNVDHSSSFPSGHVTLSLALIGFWSTIVARELRKKQRWMPYVATGIVVFLIALSRLYLGAHWLTDIVAGGLLGITLVLILTISYRRRAIHFPLRNFIMVSVGSLLFALIGYGIYAYPKEFKNYSLKFPLQIITVQKWQNEIGKAIPLYHFDRLGKPSHVFNVEWVGSLAKIERALLKQGWEKQEAVFNLPEFILRLTGNAATGYLPLLPQLYHNRPMALLMTKEVKQSYHNHVILVLRLWQSDIVIFRSDNEVVAGKEHKKNTINNNLPLWLGTVDYYSFNATIDTKSSVKTKINASDTKWLSMLLDHYQHNAMERLSTSANTTTVLDSKFNDFKEKKIIYPSTTRFKTIRNLNWNNEIFLIYPLQLTTMK